GSVEADELHGEVESVARALRDDLGETVARRELDDGGEFALGLVARLLGEPGPRGGVRGVPAARGRVPTVLAQLAATLEVRLQELVADLEEERAGREGNGWQENDLVNGSRPRSRTVPAPTWPGRAAAEGCSNSRSRVSWLAFTSS